MTPRPEWRHQPRQRPTLPQAPRRRTEYRRGRWRQYGLTTPRAPEDVAAWHAVVEREWARLFSEDAHE